MFLCAKRETSFLVKKLLIIDLLPLFLWLLRRLSQLLLFTIDCTKSQGRRWTAIELSHRPEPLRRAVYGGIDESDIGGRHGQRFVLLHHTHRQQKGLCPICWEFSAPLQWFGALGIVPLLPPSLRPFMQAGAETSDTGTEAVTPDPRCPWQGHSRKVGAGFGYESAESRGVVHIPSVIRSEHRTNVAVVVVRRLQMGVSIWDAVRAHTVDRWAVEQMSRCHGTTC